MVVLKLFSMLTHSCPAWWWRSCSLRCLLLVVKLEAEVAVGSEVVVAPIML